MSESLRDIYNAASQGDGVPTVAMLGGDVLNAMLQTDIYDPRKWYVVTEEGIEPADE